MVKKKHLAIFTVIALLLLSFLAYLYFVTNEITFSQALKPNEINYTKISVRDGNTGELRETDDVQKINSFLNKLSEEKLKKHNKNGMKGWSYSINFYIKDKNGYYNYTFPIGFSKRENLEANLITGDYDAVNYDKVEEILRDFYNSLQ